MGADEIPPARAAGLPSRFEVLEELVGGATTRCLRARDRLLEREVLLEVPGVGGPGRPGEPSARERQLREARSLARVAHPGVQRLLEVIETDDALLLVLEPVAGETLAQRLTREGRLAADEVLQIGLQVAKALEAVHAAGVLHRSIHAGAIVLGAEGRATLTRFERAKPGPGALAGLSSGPSSLVVSPGARTPSEGHPAPEQILRREDGPRADLFSLGWTLYQALTGVPPHDAADPLTWGSPPSARALVPHVPRGLDRLLTHCLALSPAQRPADAAALRRALEDLAVGAAEDREAAPVGPRPGSARDPGGWGWTTLAVTCGVALAALWIGLPHAAPPEPGPEARGLLLEGAPAPGPVKPEVLAGLKPRYERSRALLIGIRDYAQPFQDLPNAERDVAAVQSALGKERGPPWEFRTLLGAAATRAGVVDALHDLCSDARADDRLLIYYAGHGRRNEQAEGVGWMIPSDATDRPSSWIPFNEFDQLFREEPGAKHILVAIDCCYGGRVIQMLPMRSADDTSFVERLLTRRAHVVIASGLGDQQVTDGRSGTNSPFAEALVESLGRTGPPVTATELYAEIQREFARQQLAQLPLLGRSSRVGAEGGDFVFFRSAP